MANQLEVCTNCQKQFFIIEAEQNFLRNRGLPMPKLCPACRQKRRLALRGGERNLYKAQCAVCGREIVVAYDPKDVKNEIMCKKDYEEYFATHDAIVTDPLPEL